MTSTPAHCLPSGLSLVLAWAVNHLIADDTSDTLEGVFQLLAAAASFYVSSCVNRAQRATAGAPSCTIRSGLAASLGRRSPLG